HEPRLSCAKKTGNANRQSISSARVLQHIGVNRHKEVDFAVTGGVENSMLPVKPDSEATCALLKRIQDGDRAAFEELFARHRPLLRQLVEIRLDARLRARLDPSDVVQDAHMEAFRRLPDFLERKPMPFRLWLQKTAQERLRMVERQHLEASRRAVSRERA